MLLLYVVFTTGILCYILYIFYCAFVHYFLFFFIPYIIPSRTNARLVLAAELFCNAASVLHDTIGI